jgi:Mrp family chromosome partitioning ATPase/uncharacterized protein involved in exopolysaccharide biosynthesis
MNPRQKDSPPPPAAITLRDVYYVLFRHKWLIAILIALGVAAGAVVHSLWTFPYYSEAKIYIRYIQDATTPTVGDGSSKVQSLNLPANILNTELEILTSRDLAALVATNLGPEKILGKSGGSNDSSSAAASFITMHLKAGVQKNSDVILLQFSADDPTMLQPILSGLISAYRSKYVDVHLAPGMSDDALARKTEEVKGLLAQAADQLKEEKSKRGITSLDDAKKQKSDLIARTTENIYQTATELAEARSAIKDLQERIAGAMPNSPAANSLTNKTFPALPAPPSADVMDKYRNLNAILNARRVKEQELLGEFTTNNVKVQFAQKQRAAAEAELKKYEAENPGLFALKTSDDNRPGQPASPALDLNAALRDEIAKEHSLVAKYNELTNQLARVQAEAVELDGSEDKIMQAQSEKEIMAKEYDKYQQAAEQQNINETVGSKVSNISTIEQPTPPARDSTNVNKVTGGVMAFFIVLAFGLPFFIEMVLDQSLKHPSEVRARIAAPFFITIPRTNGRHGKLAALMKGRSAPLLPAGGSETPGSGAEEKAVALRTNGEVAPWDSRHELRPFFETLRDRMMTYFEMINLTHKPKLVAVTSCGAGAGVTTTAAGLASSLSETGDGNVLLVSMNAGDGEAQHFYKGKLACGIEDVLEREKRAPAQVQGNLYAAREMDADDKLPRVLPKRFSHLVPMMRASDFDYIIFDMPPVSEISITPRLARFMDMVLLVIESEKTSRDAAARVAAQLSESKTNVGLVLNKNRSYLPKRLEHNV